MISCHEHDYIEIACMYQYPIRLTMKNGDLIECKALDTQYNSSREECIKVISKGIESDVIIEKISKLEVCIENPHFKQISFS